MSRGFLVFGLLCSALGSPGASCADTYPSRPVRIIVPFSAGGPDTVARVMAQALAAQTLGLEPVGSTPAEFRLLVQAEIKKYAEMVRAAGIQPE